MYGNVINNHISWVPYTHSTIKRRLYTKSPRISHYSPVKSSHTVIKTVPDLINFAKKMVETYPTTVQNHRDMAHGLLDVWMNLDERSMDDDYDDLDGDDSDHDDYDR